MQGWYKIPFRVQYDGSEIFYEDCGKIWTWCEENLEGNFNSYPGRFLGEIVWRFELDSDASFFKLKWGSNETFLYQG